MTVSPAYQHLGRLHAPGAFRDYFRRLGLDLPFNEQVIAGTESPLAASLTLGGQTVGNRFCILPMEGWDGTRDGCPTALTVRRWERFGRSGAKLIWGGEAAAVRADGRANPNQLMIVENTIEAIAALRTVMVRAHEERFGRSDDLFVGLQLTHAGRFSRPNDKNRPEPRIAYRHLLLDRRTPGLDDSAVLGDDELRDLVDDFAHAAILARQAGFNFVDIKHCHGYLGHELLSAVSRPGAYGGTLENRSRFLREIIEKVQRLAPGLAIGVRLSAFDTVPFRKDASGVGQAEPLDGPAYGWAFGGDGTGAGFDLAEPIALLGQLSRLGVRWFCISGGSPYYNPHVLRPAMFPPMDGYRPPEDPLVGVARHLEVTARLKRAHPGLVFVGSAYSYLQEWLPHVAQAAVHGGQTDFVGIGRMALSYPDLAADVLAGRPLQRKRICRTFSDCTTAPRGGLVSGCYRLDDFYKARPEAEQLAALRPKAPLDP